MIDLEPGPKEIEAAIRENKFISRVRPKYPGKAFLSYISETAPVVTLTDELPCSKKPSEEGAVYCTKCAGDMESVVDEVFMPKIRAVLMKPKKFGWQSKKGWMRQEFHPLYDVWTGQCPECRTIFVVVSMEGDNDASVERRRRVAPREGQGGNRKEPAHPQEGMPPTESVGRLSIARMADMVATFLDAETMPGYGPGNNPIDPPQSDRPVHDQMPGLPGVVTLTSSSDGLDGTGAFQDRVRASDPAWSDPEPLRLLHLRGPVPEVPHDLPRSRTTMSHTIDKDELVRLCDAVDQFANLMKAKLITKYVNDGMAGWRDPEVLDKLREGLATHVQRGDSQSVDVANLAMMIEYHYRRSL